MQRVRLDRVDQRTAASADRTAEQRERDPAERQHRQLPGVERGHSAQPRRRRQGEQHVLQRAGDRPLRDSGRPGEAADGDAQADEPQLAGAELPPHPRERTIARRDWGGNGVHRPALRGPGDRAEAVAPANPVACDRARGHTRGGDVTTLDNQAARRDDGVALCRARRRAVWDGIGRRGTGPVRRGLRSVASAGTECPPVPNLPVAVNAEPLAAVFDTGFSRTALLPGLIRKLGLPATGQSETRGLSGMMTSAEYQLPYLRFGPVGVERLPVLGLDSDAVHFPPNTSLIIGSDLLKRSVVEIDFPNDRMRVCERDQRVALPGLTRIPATPNTERVLTIPLVLEGRPVPAAVLDTGSNAACTMSRAFAEQLGLLDGRLRSTILTAGVEGAMTDTVTTIHEIGIGSFVIRIVPVTVVDNWVLMSPANLGWPLFRALLMVLQLGAGAVWLKPDARVLSEPFPKDRSGLAAACLPDRLIVRHVAERSPAEQAGLVAGDAIVAIDGRPVDAGFPRPGERQGYRVASTMMDLELANGRHVRLILADYF